MNPYFRLVVVGWSVCHDFLKGREVTLPCSHRNTCYTYSLLSRRANSDSRDHDDDARQIKKPTKLLSSGDYNAGNSAKINQSNVAHRVNCPHIIQNGKCNNIPTKSVYKNNNNNNRIGTARYPHEKECTGNNSSIICDAFENDSHGGGGASTKIEPNVSRTKSADHAWRMPGWFKLFASLESSPLSYR